MKPTTTQVKLTEIPYQVDLLDLHVTCPDRYPFFLESAVDKTPLGRYDILFAFPGETLRLDADLAVHGLPGDRDQGFLESLDGWWSELAQPQSAGFDLPFVGGWFVFLGYELAQEIEPSLHLSHRAGLTDSVGDKNSGGRYQRPTASDRMDNCRTRFGVRCRGSQGRSGRTQGAGRFIGADPRRKPYGGATMALSGRRRRGQGAY